MSTAREIAERSEEAREPLDIVVIPHSHWDREWYATFEEFRFYLVEFMDELLELLDEDEGFRTFLLDGQVSLLDDYLEVRPEKREELRKLVREGRLEIGPWYVQPDEFLVSGEALVRNLLLGDRRGREFGPVMKQGYVPDTFGHVQQLPQILRGFGIETFYFMRGLGEDVEELRSEFLWEAPDGSRVLAHFLSETYSNAAVLGPDPERISFRHDRISEPSSYFVSYDSLYELRDRLASRAAGRAILLLNGSDHVTVQPRFSRYVFELNRAMRDRVFNGSLADFARSVLRSRPELKVYRGELRQPRYQPVLKGTYSSRIPIKQENERNQQLLEGLAERAAAVVYSMGGRDYSPFLKYAWRTLIANHAHDSIGGCSADAVHRQMFGRFDTATRVGQKIVEESLDYLAARVAPPSDEGSIPIAVFNPSPWERSGRVAVEVSLDIDVPFRRRIFDWIGEKRLDLRHSVLVDGGGKRIPFTTRGETLHIEDALYRRKAVRRATIEFHASGIPPLGYKVYHLRSGVGQESVEEPAEPPWEVELENENLKVTVEGDFTLGVLDKRSGRFYRGMNLLMDEGDAGDEYNFSPPREQETFYSSETDWEIERGEDQQSLVLRGALRLPRGLSAGRASRSEELVRCPVNVHVRLDPGSRRVEVKTEFYNRVKDHRLRACFPSGMEAEESIAESAFGVVRRPTRVEQHHDWRELESTTFAQRRFVCVEDGQGGLAILNKGLPEYEVTPEGEIRLTLLRSVGWLSRNDLATRRGHAGPALSTPEAQCQGRHIFEYAIVPYTESWLDAEIFREAEEYWLPLEARAAQQKEGREEESTGGAPGSFLKVGGRGIVLSALKKAIDKEALILRLFNASDEPSEATVRFGFPIASAYRTNLAEEVEEQIAPRGDRLNVTLGAGKIQTLMVKLDRPERWAEKVRRASRWRWREE
ncbi:alpha-mannosidase [Rubrobacter calidifluminis]|uniref:alpha-mannosidase n=1 Tax=Rubrobacter calidifluminis TaxID=1392640 RepID=UPI00235F831F|nr:glycoside hydrolase family 38 C-terminal domain-containing protein [Rubrobacter calidifluminis]